MDTLYRSTQNIHVVVEIQKSWFLNLKSCTWVLYRQGPYRIRIDTAADRIVPPRMRTTYGNTFAKIRGLKEIVWSCFLFSIFTKLLWQPCSITLSQFLNLYFSLYITNACSVSNPSYPCKGHAFKIRTVHLFTAYVWKH